MERGFWGLTGFSQIVYLENLRLSASYFLVLSKLQKAMFYEISDDLT